MGLLEVALIIALGLLVRLPIIDTPFGRNGEGTGSWYGVMARNYLRHGVWRTGLAPMISVGVNQADAPTVYSHHPPGLALSMAAVYLLLGDGEWQTRLVPSGCTLGAGAMLVILAMPAGFGAAMCVGLAFATSVMAVRFGGMPDVVGSPLVLAGLIAIWAYQRYVRSPSSGRAAAVIGTMLIGLCVDWPMAILAAVLALHAAAWGGKRGRVFAVVLMASCTVWIGLLVIDLAAAAGGIELLVKAALRRTMGAATDEGKTFGLGAWLAGAWSFNRILHGPLLAGPLLWAWTRRWALRTESDRAAALLLGWGAVHVVVGRQGCLNHDWWWWPLTPGLAMTTGLGVAGICRRFGVAAFSSASRGLAFAVVTLAVIGGWGAVAEIRRWQSPGWISGGFDDYLLHDLGDAIRKAAPPDECVLVAEWDDEPQLWYYADRPIKVAVWDSETFVRRRFDATADLVYNFSQAWSKAPVALVMPASYREKLDGLHKTLTRSGDEPTVYGRFLIYNLIPSARPRR